MNLSIREGPKSNRISIAVADGSPPPQFTTSNLSPHDVLPHPPMTFHHNQRYPWRFTIAVADGSPPPQFTTSNLTPHDISPQPALPVWWLMVHHTTRFSTKSVHHWWPFCLILPNIDHLNDAVVLPPSLFTTSNRDVSSPNHWWLFYRKIIWMIDFTFYIWN